MEYKDFEKLYLSDPVTFHLALDMLMQNGRDAIAALSEQNLAAKVTRRMCSLFVTEKAVMTAKVVREFARLNSMELLTYASRCGIKLEDDPLDRPGVCPLCGGSLIYGEDASAHRPHAIGWTCENCGATGKESYREVFDCHYDVRDAAGNLVVERNKNKE